MAVLVALSRSNDNLTSGEITFVPNGPEGCLSSCSTAYDDRRYEKGERMIADFGACFQGYLSNDDVRGLLDLGKAIEIVEAALREHGA